MRDFDLFLRKKSQKSRIADPGGIDPDPDQTLDSDWSE